MVIPEEVATAAIRAVVKVVLYEVEAVGAPTMRPIAKQSVEKRIGARK